ncbi:hypothetical protein LY78DRAFT_390599 [Colletotrichum sublineola]|nr:hypothetical protein LY78DRAFT_390599 [Colletotrichum sublineola]
MAVCGFLVGLGREERECGGLGTVKGLLSGCGIGERLDVSRVSSRQPLLLVHRPLAAGVVKSPPWLSLCSCKGPRCGLFPTLLAVGLAWHPDRPGEQDDGVGSRGVRRSIVRFRHGMRPSTDGDVPSRS